MIKWSTMKKNAVLFYQWPLHHKTSVAPSVLELGIVGSAGGGAVGYTATAGWGANIEGSNLGCVRRGNFSFYFSFFQIELN